MLNKWAGPIKWMAVGVMALFAAGAGAADAQFPSRQVRLIVGFPPGGATDIIARVAGEALSREWGQQVLVENRPGAASMIGATFVGKSQPDGHTLLVATNGMAIAKLTQAKVVVDAIKDFEPIMLMANVPFMLVGSPNIPANNLKELVELGKAKPGSLNYASFGTGTSTHFMGELMSMVAGVKMVHVPYKGSAPAMTDVMAGQVQLMFDHIGAALRQVRAGKVRAYGVVLPQRSARASDIPTFVESGLAGVSGTSWVGLMAPAGTSKAIVDKVWQDTTRLIKSSVGKVINDQGFDPVEMGPSEFRALLKEEIDKWTAVAKSAGIKPE